MLNWFLMRRHPSAFPLQKATLFPVKNVQINESDGYLRLEKCRRFCSGRSTKAQQRATGCWMLNATRATPITCSLQNSIEFNKRWNLVRDQGVGGSNPLSPTNCFQSLTVSRVGPLVVAQVPYLWKQRKHSLSRN